MVLTTRRILSMFLFAFVASAGAPGTVRAEPHPSAVMSFPDDDQEADVVRQITEAKRQVRALEDRIRQLESRLARARPAPAPVLAADTADSCAVPFFIDASGLKRVRAECLQGASENSCDLPFELGPDGIKRLRPACAAVATSRE